MHYRVICFPMYSARESTTAKQKDRLTSSLMLNVLEAIIFQYDFLQGHYVSENNCY